LIFAQIDLRFEPAFAYPGERFTVVTDARARVSADGLAFSGGNGTWVARAPQEPVEIWSTIGADGSVEAAKSKALPVASGAPTAIGSLLVVPLHGDSYAAILNGRRFAELISFELAPRSAPMRERRFNIDYRYFGGTSATLLGDAGGLMRIAVRVANEEIRVDYLTLFDLNGTMRILGKEFAISQSAPKTAGTLRLPLLPT
jgi:hypothetical protein